MSLQNHYLVILCGGSGPRLWPLSRPRKPKQFLCLLSSLSLLQQTLSRAKKICPPSHIILVANHRHRSLIRDQVKSTIPPNNVILESSSKNTLPAICQAVAKIKKQQAQASLTILPADHLIKPISAFKKDIKQSVSATTTFSKIVLIGVKPTAPDPSYGYIIAKTNPGLIYPVVRFFEKPDPATASQLLRQSCFWNSGIYTFTIPSFENELSHHQAEIYRAYLALCQSPQNYQQFYQSVEPLSFDIAISEKSSNLLMIPASFYWNDLGEWQTIWQESRKDQHGHSALPPGRFLALDSNNCLINAAKNKLVGLIGVNQLAIIDSPDALLICRLQDSYHVKHLVTQIVQSTKLKKFFL